MSRRLFNRTFLSKLFGVNSRKCSNGIVYEKTKITNKQLDVSTLYQLDKYSR